MESTPGKHSSQMKLISIPPVTGTQNQKASVDTQARIDFKIILASDEARLAIGTMVAE